MAARKAEREERMVAKVAAAVAVREPGQARGFDPILVGEKASLGKGSRERRFALVGLGGGGGGGTLPKAEGGTVDGRTRSSDGAVDLLQEALRSLISSARPELPFDPWPNGRNGEQGRF